MIAAALSLLQLTSAGAQEQPADDYQMQEVVVHGRAEDILGVASSTSQGAVGAEQIDTTPILRKGELLETVPGMVVSAGKDVFDVTANAYVAPQWRATDQIPQRAIDQGLISRFDAIDPSDGGRCAAQIQRIRVARHRCTKRGARLDLRARTARRRCRHELCGSPGQFSSALARC
jgi:hypothetical protein